MTTALERPRLSANSLRDLDECKRRFALRYRINRYWPGPLPQEQAPPGAKEAIRTGQVFHMLVQQHSLGMDIRRQLEAEASELPHLETMWRMFEASPHAHVRDRFWTEASLHFTFQDLPFFVRYDRLYRHGDAWEILDWKTGKQGRDQLKKSWQTRLYRFALVQAGEVFNDGAPIPPESVRITYWDVSRGRPETFEYDAAAYRADQVEFTAQASTAMRPFDESADDDLHFPRTLKRTDCERCAFNSYCNPANFPSRGPAAPVQLTLPTFTLETEAP